MTEATDNTTGPSLGQILLQAREEKGWSQAEVATRLRLKVQLIEKMESEQWDTAVATTFMRGYLRSYAKLLKLPESEILQAYALQTAYLKQQPKPMASFSNKVRLDAAENRFMLASFLLLVVLVGLFLVWIWQTHLLDNQPVSVLTDYQEINAPAARIPEQAEPVATMRSTMPEPALTINENAAITAQSPSSQPETTAEIINDPQPATAATATAQAVAISPTETAGEHQLTSVMPTTQTPAPAESAERVAVAGAAVLNLSFSADCWVAVIDADNKRLTYQMYSAGQQVKLQGALPLQLTIGNPAVATIELNGQVVDLSSYRHGQVARLTLTGSP